jgi:hypothetical protein
VSKKLSAKQWQREIDRSKRRWMTLASIVAGVGALLVATAVWPDTDRDDTENSGETSISRPLKQ